MKNGLYFRRLFVSAFSSVFLLMVAQTTFAQPQTKCLGQKLSLQNILNVLQGETTTRWSVEEKNSYASNCVKKDGVSFIITASDETKLTNAGAKNSLIDAIRIECGLPAMQNQKPYSPDIAWNSSPRLAGKWELLDLADSKFMTDRLLKETPPKLAATIRQIKKFRTLLLPFYPGAELVEGLVPGAGVLTFVVLRNGSITLLNGTSPPLHELNAQVPLLIDDEEKAEAYLKFFCFQLHGEEGDFRLIEDEKEVAWMKTVTPDVRQQVTKKLTQIKINKADDKSWSAEATVQYSDALFHAKFELKKTGMVNMLEDEPLLAELPIRGEVFKGYLRVEFEDKNASKSSAETDYANRANQLFNTGDYKNAILLYSEAIKANPKNPDLYMQRGYSYHFYGEGDTALLDYNQAIKLKPELGSSALLKCLPFPPNDKNPDAALASCNQAIKELPKNSPILSLLYYKRAVVFNTKADNEAAIADLSEAVKLNPKFIGAYRNAGIFFFEQKEYDDAISAYGKTIELRPDFIEVYIWRALAYYEKSLAEPIRIRVKETGSYNLAIKDFNKAIELNPKNGYAYVYRGNMYLKEKIYDKAIVDFSESIRLEPAYAEAYLKRGESYENQGKFDLAIADYRKTLQLEPANKPAKEKLDALLKKKQ